MKSAYKLSYQYIN